MILPDKHIRVNDSLLATGGLLLRSLERPKTVSTLWDSAKKIPTIESFKKFTLTLDFLFIIGAIKLEKNMLRRADDTQDNS